MSKKSKSTKSNKATNKKAKTKASLNVFPKSISASKGRALINTNNRTPKTMDVLLSYKQMIRITQNSPNIPQFPLASGFPFRISLNSPMNPQGEILHVHTTGHGTNSYVVNNSVNNHLTTELAATGLPDKYRYFYVKKSVVDVVVQNQINQTGLVESLQNEDMTQTDNTQTTYIQMGDATLTGELINCAHITEDNAENLNTLTVHDIRENISGTTVKESLVFPDSRGTSNRFRYTYTPKKRFNIRDIRDNLDLLRFEKDGSITSPYESHLNMCVGKQLFPATQLKSSALQTVDIRVQYIITAYERLSDVGSNDAIPAKRAHQGEL